MPQILTEGVDVVEVTEEDEEEGVTEEVIEEEGEAEEVIEEEEVAQDAQEELVRLGAGAVEGVGIKLHQQQLQVLVRLIQSDN